MWNAGWRVRLGVQRTEEGGGGQQPELQEFAHIPSVVQPRQQRPGCSMRPRGMHGDQLPWAGQGSRLLHAITAVEVGVELLAHLSRDQGP